MFDDKCFKFPDEATAKPLLYELGSATITEPETGEVTTIETKTPKYQNICVLGILMELFPIPYPEDYVPIPMEGYHVNIRFVEGETYEALAPYIVVPANPRCVWASDPA